VVALDGTISTSGTAKSQHSRSIRLRQEQLLRCIGGWSRDSGRSASKGKRITEPPADAGFVFQQELMVD